jgi:hypothetical protein
MEPDNPQPEQQAWITSYVQKFHNSLRSGNPSNAQTGYPAYIDVDSFVDRIIHNELAREGDSYIRSTHFFKDRGGKLTAGPLWDYDLGYDAVPMTGFGMPGMPATSAVEGWQYQPMGFGMPGMSSGVDWFQKLMADPAFLAKVKARWQTLRRGVMSDAQLTSRLNALSAPLASAAKRNFQRWPILNTGRVGMFTTQTSSSWEQQLQIMRTFLTQRAAWLDSSAGWGSGSVPPPTGPPTTNPPPGGRACSATIARAESWGDRFNSTVTVRAGNAAITSWTVVVRLTPPQSIQNTWNGTFAWNSGTSQLTVQSSGNGNLAAGATTSFGFTTMTSGNTTLPAIVSCAAS